MYIQSDLQKKYRVKAVFDSRQKRRAHFFPAIWLAVEIYCAIDLVCSILIAPESSITPFFERGTFLCQSKTALRPKKKYTLFSNYS